MTNCNKQKQDDKKQKLAEALRSNMKRRKEQQKASKKEE